ncbi:hypothetical protein EJ06DRAFT_322313 [Trichodelitschia bisporula]|uniref:Uncharacterized protein n=1 Tax=Trichodelitschia bisporula TaxID=703511 RepID=A0A6G1I4X8_9PEZI|nr:hypothetical protein EJ06DRAFT_322313 [Trichodelitschia bisporula]
MRLDRLPPGFADIMSRDMLGLMMTFMDGLSFHAAGYPSAAYLSRDIDLPPAGPRHTYPHLNLRATSTQMLYKCGPQIRAQSPSPRYFSRSTPPLWDVIRQFMVECALLCLLLVALCRGTVFHNTFHALSVLRECTALPLPATCPHRTTVRSVPFGVEIPRLGRQSTRHPCSTGSPSPSPSPSSSWWCWFGAFGRGEEVGRWCRSLSHVLLRLLSFFASLFFHGSGPDMLTNFLSGVGSSWFMHDDGIHRFGRDRSAIPTLMVYGSPFSLSGAHRSAVAVIGDAMRAAMSQDVLLSTAHIPVHGMSNWTWTSSLP